MTAVIGVLCRDGVIVGADSAATLNSGQIRTVQQPVEKITILPPATIVAGTGTTGLLQRFRRVVEMRMGAPGFSGLDSIGVGKEICRDTLLDFRETGVQPKAFGGLLASIVEQVPALIEFPVDPPLQPDPKDANLFFFSMGSGQQNLDPFLAFMREIFWPNGQPTLEEAAFIVTWALDFAIRTAPGGLGPPTRIAVLRQHGNAGYRAEMLTEAELQEHRALIEEAEERLRSVLGSAPQAVPKLSP